MTREKGNQEPMNNETTSVGLVEAPSSIPSHLHDQDNVTESVSEILTTEEDGRALALSELLRVPLVKLATLTIDPQALTFVTEEAARKYKVLPIKIEEADSRSLARRILVVAMEDPGDLQAIAHIEFSSGCRVTPLVATASEIRDAI